jgi:beta-lactam-binding protein with PASTA domain
VSQVTDAADPGIILAQSPPSGTEIAGVMALDLVISKGPRGNLVEVPEYVELPFQEALDYLARINLPFVFRVRPAARDQVGGMIVSQSPEAGQEIPYSSILQLEMTVPTTLPDGFAFGLIESTLPNYEILVDLRLEVITPTEVRTLLLMKLPGGPIALPYIAEENGQLVLLQFGDEIVSQPVSR